MEVTFTLEKSTGTRLRGCICVIISTAILLGISIFSVPANAQGTLRHTYSEGINLISIPFDYANDESTDYGNPFEVFGFTSAPDKTEFDFFAWSVGSFYSCFDLSDQALPAREVRTARGFFLYSPESPLSVYASSSVAVLESLKIEPYPINLYTGWNLIGAPYHSSEDAFSVLWYSGAVKCQVGTSDPISIRDAITAGIIKPGLWSYIGGRYELSYTLDEWKGYWVKANQGCRLLVYRTDTRESRAADVAPKQSVAAGDWSQQLVVNSRGSVQDSIQFGVARNATDGYDLLIDFEKPPAITISSYAYINFPNTDWAINSGAYGLDIRSQGGRKVWKVMVASNVKGSDMVLTWPGIANLPKDVNLTLVDEETGATRRMRTCSGYQFRMAPGTDSRRFRIESSPDTQGTLRIAGLTAAASRGGSRTLTCTLSDDASVDVLIKPATGGQVVRIVANGLTRAAGLNQFVWDCRDEDGKPVPAGVYMCEVRATGDDGQVVKAATVLMVAR